MQTRIILCKHSLEVINFKFLAQSGTIDEEREFVVTAFEKHTPCRVNLLGFPRRALHTKDWTYIRNYNPNRWPYGAPNVYIEDWGFYGDIDPGRTKQYILDYQNEADFEPFYDLCFGKVPAEELYNKNEDIAMIHNLASNPKHKSKLNELRKKLTNYLKETKDPRAEGKSPWDDYNYDKPEGKVVETN